MTCMLAAVWVAVSGAPLSVGSLLDRRHLLVLRQAPGSTLAFLGALHDPAHLLVEIGIRHCVRLVFLYELQDRHGVAEAFGVPIDRQGLFADCPGPCGGGCHDPGTPEEQREFRRALAGGGFMAWGRGSSVWIEASLPKRAGDDNVTAVGLEKAKDLLIDLHNEAGRFVEWDSLRGAANVEAAAVKRLDLVRDFRDVVSLPALLDGLANVSVPGRTGQRRFADGDRNEAQTLSIGPRTAWQATLYDKHAETGGLAPEGQLRFEARLRSDILTGQWARDRQAVVRQVVDLEEGKLERLRRGIFQRVGFDREVHPMGHRLAEIVNSANLSAQVQAGLWTYVTGPCFGLSFDVSRPTERKYRRMAEELGVVVAGRTHEASIVTVRRGYERGTEERAVAA